MPQCIIIKYLQEAKELLESVLQNQFLINQIDEAANIIVKSFKKGGKLLCCGNGGSFCDAMHLAEELTGKFRQDRAPLAAIAISDGAHMSCVANDYGYEQVFARYLKAHAKKDDVFLSISTSGKSPNILKALEVAKELNIKTISLTGLSPNPSSSLVDIEISVVPVGKHYFSDHIQEMHIKIIHILIYLIEHKMFNFAKEC